jgi:Protein of unknown function (DUF1569)
MPTIFDPAARAGIRARVDQLTADRIPRWGKMDAGRMVAHISDALRMGLGELRCAPRKTPFRNPVLKRLIIYVIPWPKGTPTAPELLQRAPGDWQADLDTLRTLIDRYGERTPDGAWPEHPTFGRLSGRLWGALTWRHLDHHLRQFGL